MLRGDGRRIGPGGQRGLCGGVLGQMRRLGAEQVGVRHARHSAQHTTGLEEETPEHAATGEHERGDDHRGDNTFGHHGRTPCRADHAGGKSATPTGEPWFSRRPPRFPPGRPGEQG
ncbi:hypothetical protein GCM10023192_40890 [Amycolatopsis samaneae]